MRVRLTFWTLLLAVINAAPFPLLAASPTNRVTLWSYFATEQIGNPAFGPGGEIYVVADRALLALSTNGSTLWRHITELPVQGTPTVADDGTIYCPIYNGELGAWAPDGRFKWSFKTGGYIATASVGRDQNVYFNSADGNLYAIDPSGEKIWSLPLQPTGGTPPAIGGDGAIYIVGGSNELFAVNPNGTVRWSIAVNGQSTTPPAIGGDGTIYFGAYGKELHAVSPGGVKLWSFPTAEPFNSVSPLVSSDGTIFCAAGQTLYALTPDGRKKWQFDSPSSIEGTPVIDAQGNIYFHSYERIFYALNANGDTMWSIEDTHRNNGSPALSHEGRLAIPNFLSLQVFDIGAPLNSGPWPMLQQDPHRRGRAFPLPQVQITSPPDRAVFIEGGIIEISAAASTPNGGIARVEFYSGTNLLGAATTAPYVIQWTNAPLGIHHLTARVSDALGASIRSGSVQIDVTAPATPPQFTLQPQSQQISNGETIHLSADLFGTPPISLQWFKDGAPLSGATNRELVIASAQLADSATYYIRATNSAGAIQSTNALVSVLQPYDIKWSVDSVRNFSSPAIAAGTRVVVASMNGMQSFGPNGQFLWRFDTEHQVFAAPAVGANNNIYFGSQDGNFHSLVEDGELRWSWKRGNASYGGVAISTNRDIYAVIGETLVALTEDGGLLWTNSLPNVSYSSPAIGRNGTIYLGTFARYIPERTNFSAHFLAISPDGSTRWSIELTNSVLSSAAIAEDGTVIFGSSDHRIYALSPGGRIRWEFPTSGPVDGSPAIGPDGTIYIAGVGPQEGPFKPGILYALTPDGELKWSYKLHQGVQGAPAIARDGTIYIGSLSGYLYALNSNGTLKWQHLAGSAIYSSPAIGFDGTVYFTSGDRLIAIEGTSPLARSAWPMFQRDVKHSGNAAAPFDSDTFFYPFSSNAFDDPVDRLVGDGEKIYVGGRFTTAGGVPGNHIAMWDGRRWNALGAGVNDRVAAIAADGTNVYAGGFFTRAGQANAQFVARWDGEQWHPMGSNTVNYVYDLEFFNGALIGSGGFRDGEMPEDPVATWNGSTWVPMGQGLRGPVFDLYIDGTNLLASGFNNLFPSSSRVSCVARWTGSAWAPVGSIVGYGGVMARYKNHLYLGGERLQSSLGTQAPEGALARYDGTNWVLFANLPTSHIYALAVSGDHLYVGGTFTNIGTVAANRIARYDGTNWTRLSSGVSGMLPNYLPAVHSILPRGDDIFVGGAFTRTGGEPNIFHFGRFDGFQWSSFGPKLDFIDGQFQLILGNSIGTSYAIQASSDLIHWDNVATFTGETNAVRLIDPGSTNTSQRFYRAIKP